MDPTACLDRVLVALKQKDRKEAIEALHDLAEWLENGGYLPDVPNVSDVS